MWYRTTPDALAELKSWLENEIASLDDDEPTSLSGYHVVVHAVADDDEMSAMIEEARMIAEPKPSITGTNVLTITACQDLRTDETADRGVRTDLSLGYSLTARAPGATMDLVSWRDGTRMLQDHFDTKYELALEEGKITTHASVKELRTHLEDSLASAGPKVATAFPDYKVILEVTPDRSAATEAYWERADRGTGN
jgi:hypothetical protein